MAEFALAAILGLGSASLVYHEFEASESTKCYRASLDISIARSEGSLPGCDLPTFDDVRAQVTEQRLRLAEDSAFVPNEPEPVKGRSDLVVWMSLFAATAGLAGFGAVRSVFMIWFDMKPKWGLDRWAILGSGCFTALVLFLPPMMLRAGDGLRLSLYDDLHQSLIRSMTLFVMVLVFPTAFGLRLIGNIVRARADRSLSDLARLGSQMRTFISLLGGVLSLAVLGTASRWQAIAALPGGESIPSTAVLLWGGVYALALAVLYVPAHERLAEATRGRIAGEVRRQFQGRRTLATPGLSAPELALKKELQATIGLGGALGSLQGSLSVLAPIIAAAISSLFS